MKPTREERAAMTKEELLRAIWLLDDIIEQQTWIPVSDRLPYIGIIDPITGKYKTYLCTLLIGGEKIVKILMYDRYGRWVDSEINFSKYVIAWMPKPDPYKE